ncbi:hypothetical protein AKI39_12275 [Bordetella sp. H567]|nr:hypothetical protein AKI39_12275 [Bordetella sp. H567]
MPLSPTWPDIALRLALTMVAGAVIGFNREARGHAAGLRTTILVCLAASVAMVQANILLTLSGKTLSSFVVMDLMRLPLGVLTGVGFIGGGAILRKGDLLTGVTTAATLWLVTIIGLCLGGGQLALGICATVLGVFTLWVLKRVDLAIPHEHWARVVVLDDPGADTLRDLPALVAAKGRATHCQAYFESRQETGERAQAEYAFRLAWRCRPGTDMSLHVLTWIQSRYQVKCFDMASQDKG